MFSAIPVVFRLVWYLESTRIWPVGRFFYVPNPRVIVLLTNSDNMA